VAPIALLMIHPAVAQDATFNSIVSPLRVEIIEPPLASRKQLREAFVTLHRKVPSIVRDDAVCRRLMTIPGVGPVVSLAFNSTIDALALQELKGGRSGLGVDASPESIGPVGWRSSCIACGSHWTGR
jgi:transposase